MRIDLSFKFFKYMFFFSIECIRDGVLLLHGLDQVLLCIEFMCFQARLCIIHQQEQASSWTPQG